MRLHRLELAAFGPFAGRQRVDFDELSAAGLFLLHGPTGAGKTSVLDAVCFALYGQVPGARPAARLRSDHAAPATVTEVVLELTVGERRLEITRRPEQPRAKKRGTGTTLDKAVTLLRERVDGEWRGLSRSHQEIGEEIKQLVGMSCEQFCQVVLLPQGEFATFLRASAIERATLLGRLFDTRRFQGVEHWLRDRKADVAQQLALGDEELRRLEARLRQAAGPAADDGPDDGPARSAGDGAGEPDTAASLPVLAAVLRCDAREWHAVTRQATTHAESAHAAATETLAAARHLDALQRRHADALARAATLDAHRPARTAARAALALAHRAALVDPALALRDKAAAQHAFSATTAAAALSELAAVAAQDAPVTSAAAPAGSAPSDPAARPGGGILSAVGDDAAPRAGGGDVPAARRPARDEAGVPGPRSAASAAGGDPDPELAAALARRAGELREELGGLEAARDAERQLAEIAGRRAALEREERDDEDVVRECAAWLTEWPLLRGRLTARVDARLENAARAAGSAAELDAARRRAEAAASRDRLTEESAAAADRVRDARDRAAAARERWHDLREARIAGIAAELAGALTDGDPCRVCGATEHPAPARPSARQVGRTDEDSAFADFQRESAAYDSARDRLTRLTAERDAAAADVGDTPYAELATAHEVLAREHQQVAAAAQDVGAAQAALAGAESERDRRTAQRHQAQERTAGRTSRREELDDRQARLAAVLDRALVGHAGVEARRGQLASRIALLDRAAHAVRDRADGGHRLAEAEAALADAASRAGFGSVREAAAALMPQARLWDAQRQADVWAKEEAALEADLTAPEPAAAAALPPADPATAQHALDDAGRRLRAASTAESAAATRCRELDLLSAQAAARVRELGPAREEFTRIRRLADLASANSTENRYRMGLETYVLAARLEQVAAAAGVRLQRMSGGRYTLVHSDARSGGRAKSGLGLLVVDAWTGTERDTATLSGGETFFASLALALGLADVVTDESGGTRLDTLFIDEGFGSLDDQTLDEVLDVLDGLRERDRAVGIVSHVADLRHRIPAQLRVAKGRDGSTVRMRAAAART
ncbi:SMC family ATPase [Streptomyces sp. V4-01]|uniref:Nuclease SbcCD subunit C n=1 Tax=Actinacidiphila polyblastidii TaxID=3110430 RepID=A0ABU7PDT3_9ACTN|nr:SMC family ATPase [Streptomyces sp. V4-01]